MGSILQAPQPEVIMMTKSMKMAWLLYKGGTMSDDYLILADEIALADWLITEEDEVWRDL